MGKLSRTTIGDLFDEAASRFPDREALIDIPQGRRYSYQEFVREFPMTPLGKVQKFRMREIAIKEYGLE